MRKSFVILLLMLTLCFIMCGCNNTSETVEIIEATPAPSATVEPEAEININGELIKESQLFEGYTFDLFGQEVNTAETEILEYYKVDIGDENLEQFRAVLPYMSKLSYLSFDRCSLSDEAVANLRDDFPDIKIAWRIFFGPFSCMTDVEKIWASCDLYDDMTEPLKYCNDVKYLDVGHCTLKDYGFLQYMPKLEVLIISCGDVEDITPIGDYCHNLVFLEAAETKLYDISPVANCTTLKYLNVGGNGNMDPDSFRELYSLPNLERFYCQNFYNYDINMTDEANIVKELMPECDINFSWNGDSALNYQWRYKRGLFEGGYTDMYAWIREIFEYDDPCGSTRLYE